MGPYFEVVFHGVTVSSQLKQGHPYFSLLVAAGDLPKQA